MYNGTKCNEVEEAHGALPLSLLCVRGPQFQNDEIECLMSEACVNWVSVFHGNICLPYEYLPLYTRPSRVINWLFVY